MNEAQGGHEGSSRSHCALFLTLLRLGPEGLTQSTSPAGLEAQQSPDSSAL